MQDKADARRVRQPATILLVGTNLGLLGALRSLLSLEGFEVHGAPSLSEAVSSLDRLGDRVGLVIADLSGADPGCVTIVHFLRRQRASTPVLAILPACGCGPGAAQLEAGEIQCLRKPLEPLRVLEAVYGALRTEGGPRSSCPTEPEQHAAV